MFTYIAPYILVFVLAVFAIFSFYASLSMNDLKHNNNLLASLILSLGDGFYLWDEKKRVERFSPNLHILLNSVFCSFNELANFFEESDQLRKNFSEARRINKSFAIDLKGRDSEIYCFCHGQSIVDDQDRIVGVLLWIQNVTGGRSLISNLKKENARLSRSLADYSDMVNALPYPIWKRSPSSDVEIHNPFYVKLMKDNKNGDIFTRQHATATHRDSENTALKEKIFMIVDNERRLYSLTEISTERGDFIGYGQDITQSWQLMEEIKGYTQMQKNILRSLPCAAAIYGSDGRLLFFNGHFSKFWQLEHLRTDKGATYSDIIRKIYESRKFIDDKAFELLKKQQYELFGKLSEPYHDTLTLKSGVLEISVVPNHRQELLFLYSHNQLKQSKN
ncbi:hypothetical protein APHWI1_0491 [Anaplasma phagocytophilum str. ApWI1]|uniref:Uncharacterized protein n=3 Tax=Anaplasma phagocytophilum TaxID=948 RepID=Q2GJB0_ANAPZ|nr:hypothetical protein [Anaplasma phagocytophilum]ABD44395.1 conserved hypothetical protein [Anaplasma phagocytophilum str. HZ]AGR78965.1 hypothetical protein YYU_04465 [Anaplasma phagocytophilum str. HZ2]AGR80212.1 hypothetical protein WSQ_04500 [Anaplasma phagocytophilum str. JM]AGR81467.1 hypothetical protein YYY_04495 [Anaplasma phagocytophilum str. Dog2]EOA61218.1 hypothetical protein HGE1_04167 [Anaplasma phagocytophilum str. HGE1]KDB56078.1 hypothetical protein O997_04520 [Anaplasma p